MQHTKDPAHAEKLFPTEIGSKTLPGRKTLRAGTCARPENAPDENIYDGNVSPEKAVSTGDGFSISRRAVMRALAAIGVAGATTEKAFSAGTLSGEDPANGLPAGVSPEVWANYRAMKPALERLQHHLLCAALTADEIVGEDAVRWWISMGRWPDSDRPSFALDAYYEQVEDVSPKMPRGIVVERSQRLAWFMNGMLLDAEQCADRGYGRSVWS